MMKIISWNVNGINACIQKGLLNFIKKEDADIYCFQETKADDSKMQQGMLGLDGYQFIWNSAKKKGYSGVLVLTKKKPLSIIRGIGHSTDDEGRVLTLEYEKFYLVNAYFVNTQRELVRLDLKMSFNEAMLKHIEKLRKKKDVILTGDFNVAHTEIDLANPKQNEKNAGFTIQERSWFDKLVAAGWVDTFRESEKKGGHYTWWTYRFSARERNIGWRIDYFVVNKEFIKKVAGSSIMSKVKGSDHCPIRLDLNI